MTCYDIQWIETPKCSECSELSPIKGRYCCLGCYKSLKKKVKAKEKRQHSHLLEKEYKERIKEVVRLRFEGKSYAAIGIQLNIPRSTVQSIIVAYNKKYQIKTA